MANEKRLIDYNKMYLSVMDAVLSSCDEDTIFDIMDASVVDAVEVVRCKDCNHCDPENYHCDHYMGTVVPLSRKPDDFCSYGERKEGAD